MTHDSWVRTHELWFKSHCCMLQNPLQKWFGGEFSVKLLGFMPENQSHRHRTEQGIGCFYRNPLLKPCWLHLTMTELEYTLWHWHCRLQLRHPPSLPLVRFFSHNHAPEGRRRNDWLVHGGLWGFGEGMKKSKGLNVGQGGPKARTRSGTWPVCQKPSCTLSHCQAGWTTRETPHPTHAKWVSILQWDYNEWKLKVRVQVPIVLKSSLKRVTWHPSKKRTTIWRGPFHFHSFWSFCQVLCFIHLNSHDSWLMTHESGLTSYDSGVIVACCRTPFRNDSGENFQWNY